MSEDGGALELYAAERVDVSGSAAAASEATGKRRKLSPTQRTMLIPATTPSTRVLPLFNRMALFEVKPGTTGQCEIR